MAQRSKESFLARFNDAITGLYRSGQSQGIGSNDHRDLVQDIVDSIAFLGDLNNFSVPFTRLFITSAEAEWDWYNGYFSFGLVEASADFELSFVNQVLGAQGTLFVKKTVASDVVITIPLHQRVGESTTTTTINLSGDDDQIFRIDFFKSETSSFNQVAETAVAFDKIMHLDSSNVLGFKGQDLYKSTDGGSNWTVSYSTSDDEIIDFFFTGNDGVLLTRSVNGNNYDFALYTSADGGGSFSSYSVGSTLSNRNITHCMKVVRYSSSVYYTAGDLGVGNTPIIYYITSNTATTCTGTGGARTIGSDFELLSTDLWITALGHTTISSAVLKRTGNTTFTVFESSPIFGNVILTVAAATSSLVIASGSDSTQNPIIAKSVDGGGTFASKTIDSDIGVIRKIDAVSATSFILIGDNGIGYSTDSGETWIYYVTPTGGDALSVWDSDDILIASSNSVFKGFGSTIGDICQLHGSASTSEGTILKASVNIAGGAALRGIGSSPATLIPAPGADLYINIISIAVSYNYGTAVYNFGANGIFRFAGGGSVGYLIDSSFLNANADYNVIGTTQANASSGGGFQSAPTNTAFTLGTVGNVNATTGDGDLDIVIYYTVESKNI